MRNDVMEPDTLWGTKLGRSVKSRDTDRNDVSRLHTLPEDRVAEVAKLRRENQELRGTNELLKAASAFHVRTRPTTLKNDPIH